MEYLVLDGFVMENGEFAPVGEVVEVSEEHVPGLLARRLIEPVADGPAEPGEDE